MGVYDMLPRGSQVKCWNCEMVIKKVGDRVGKGNYIVLLQEGGYVKVTDGVIEKIIENYGRKLYYPEDFPGITCIDKWGRAVEKKEELENRCMLGYHYYFSHDK